MSASKLLFTCVYYGKEKLHNQLFLKVILCSFFPLKMTLLKYFLLFIELHQGECYPAIDPVHLGDVASACPNWIGVFSWECAGQETKLILSCTRPAGHILSMAGVPFSLSLKCKNGFEAIILGIKST